VGINLKKHNRIAYDKVKNSLVEDKMTAIVHPTGTGKTYIALKWIEEHGGKTLYVAPTNHIINQVKETIEAAKANSELSDEEYARYQQVEFKTYIKLMELSKVGVGYETIILDEFHRCGAPEWGKGVQRLLEANSNAKVIGMTATPIRAVDNKDMADELFQGKVASEMTLEETVAEGIIRAPIYVNGIYSLETTMVGIEERIKKIRDGKLREELERELKEAKEKARRHLENAEGIEDIIGKYANKKDGKYIVFCNDIEDMHKKMIEAERWFSKVGRVKLYSISYRANEERNEKTLRMFKEETDGKVHLLFCVDKLNEGVHVNGIDGVIMLRKTESPIVYMQQLGRALSAGNERTPLVLDLVNNIDSMDYIHQFMKRVEEIRRERGITDESIGTIKIYENQRDVKEILREITEKLRRDSSVIFIFVKVCESLAKQGFDFKRFVYTKMKEVNGQRKSVGKILEDIVKEHPEIDIEKLLKETGVDTNYKIGQIRMQAVQSAKGRRGYPITEEEKQRLIELGVINLEEKETAVTQFLRVCEALAKRGFDFRRFIWQRVREVNGQRKSVEKTLEDIVKEYPEIDVERILEETGVDIDYKIGQIKSYVLKAVKGRKGNLITEKEKQRLIKLGVINLEEKETSVAQFLRVCEALAKQGFSFKDFEWSYTIGKNRKNKTLEDIAKEYPEINIENVIAETGVSTDYGMGKFKMYALQAAKGRKGSPITESEKQRLIELGIINLEEKETVIGQFLRVCESLAKQGFDFKGFVYTKRKEVNGKRKSVEKTLEDIAKEYPEVNIENVIAETGVNMNYRIGKIKSYVLQVLKGTASYLMTESEKQGLIELGVINLEEKETAIGQFLRVCESLTKQGFDFKRFIYTKVVEKNEKRIQIDKTLEDIAQEHPEIDIEKVLKETGVDTDYKVGMIKISALQAARGNEDYLMTESEKQRLIELGVINLEEKETSVAQFLRVCEALAKQGFDFKRFAYTKKKEVNGKRKKVAKSLEDIEKEHPEIDIGRILGETGVDTDYKIGQIRMYVLQVAKRRGPITEEEKQRLIELGVINLTEKFSQILGQATFTAGIDGQKQLDEAQKVLDQAIREQLNQKEQK